MNPTITEQEVIDIAEAVFEASAADRQALAESAKDDDTPTGAVVRHALDLLTKPYPCKNASQFARLLQYWLGAYGRAHVTVTDTRRERVAAARHAVAV